MSTPRPPTKYWPRNRGSPLPVGPVAGPACPGPAPGVEPGVVPGAPPGLKAIVVVWALPTTSHRHPHPTGVGETLASVTPGRKGGCDSQNACLLLTTPVAASTRNPPLGHVSVKSPSQAARNGVPGPPPAAGIVPGPTTMRR